MPFYFDYDLLLLAVPAVLFAGEMLSPQPPARRRRNPIAGSCRSWMILFATLLVNGPLSHFIGIGLIAPAAGDGRRFFDHACTPTAADRQVPRLVRRRDRRDAQAPRSGLKYWGGGFSRHR